MNIWIMNHYAGHMYFDKGGRHYSIAKYLKAMGHEPVVFCCNARHGVEEKYFELEKSLWKKSIAEEIGVPFVFVDARTYSGNGLQRVKNMIEFFCNVKKAAKQYAKENGIPDVIYASSVHPLTLVAGIQLAKKFGVKCVCEVRDLWPESIVVYSRLSRKNPVIQMLYQLEKWIYQRADALMFTMEGGKQYIIEKGWDKIVNVSKIHHVNNGVDLAEFQKNKELFEYKDADLEKQDVFKVIYTGSIRKVNNLQKIVQCANECQKRDVEVEFLLYGDGDERAYLQEKCKKLGLENIKFKGRVDKKYIPSILSKADVNILHWENTEITKYGCSLNKLFEYLAAGKMIVSTVQVGFDLLKQFACGIVSKSQDSNDITNAIMKCKEMSLDEMCLCENNAFECAKLHDYKVLTDKIEKILVEVSENER